MLAHIHNFILVLANLQCIFVSIIFSLTASVCSVYYYAVVLFSSCFRLSFLCQSLS
jgi:hypothetical protein